MDREKFRNLESMKWTSSSAASKGPKRLCKFCLLGILLPIVLLCVPLYMRFQALRPYIFTLSPSDMRLLNQEGRVSTVWCEGQVLSMNGTFNAYLLQERPKLRRWRQHVTMNRNMMLQDDIKEYWGFYLLRGSTVRLSVCSRHEGASFIVVKGLKDARRCSYLGELDSNEESDEISDEFEFNHRITPDDKEMELVFSKVVNNNETTPSSFSAHSQGRRRNSTVDDDLQMFSSFLDNFKSMNQTSRHYLLWKLLKSMDEDPKSEEIFSDVERLNKFVAFQVQSKEGTINQTTTTERNVRGAIEVNDDEEEANHGGEFDEDVVYDLLHVGKFDQQNFNGKKDKSREETKSSWSSSEEALAACEGLIFNVPLNGGTKCTQDANSETLEQIRTSVELEVSDTAFYYFIFANENEMTDNFLSARFELHKTVFDVSNTLMNCTGLSKCELPLTFWSEDHVVIEVPEFQVPNSQNGTEDSDLCSEESLLKGFSSLDECHQILLAESVCLPRKPVYMLFLFLVPVMILFCAHV